MRFEACRDLLHQGSIDQFADPAAAGFGLQNVGFGGRARRRIGADAIGWKTRQVRLSVRQRPLGRRRIGQDSRLHEDSRRSDLCDVLCVIHTGGDLMLGIDQIVVDFQPINGIF
jgi:hypothetical protein